MTVTSLLINFSNFKLPHWIALGVGALVLIVTFSIGAKKGFSNLKLRPFSWAVACGGFVALELFLHDKCFIAGMFKNANPAVLSFLSTMTWLAVALLARWILFGVLGIILRASQNAKLKKAKARDLKEREGGEILLSDENQTYKMLPFGDKVKPGPLNRLFGGLFAVINVAAVLAAVAAFAMVVLRVTPLYAKISWLYTGGMEKVWGYVRAYALDCIMIALICAIVIKGYREGLLNGIRTLGVGILKVLAIAGGLALPFLPIAKEGAALGFLSVGAQKIAGIIPLPALLATIMPIIIKVIFGIVLAVVAWLITKLLGWLIGKLLDVVDGVDTLWRIDGFIGAIVYIVLALLVVGFIAAVLYALEYYDVFMSSQLFSAKSPIMGGLFDIFDWKLRPLLEKATAFFVR